MRIDHAIHMLALGLGDRQHRVVDAMGGDWPTIVLAGRRDVDFVATPWAMLVGPELAGPRVERRTLLVAMAERPDLGPNVVFANERVVLRHFTVGQNAYDLALQLVQVLGGRALIVLAQGDEQVAVAVEHQARTEVIALRELGLLAEDHREVFQSRTVLGQLATADRCSGLAVIALLGIRQVDGAILGELRRQHDIQQAALAFGPDAGHATDGGADLAFGTDHPQIARALGDEHVLASGQKCQGPWVTQAIGHGTDDQLPLFTGQALFRRGLRQQGQQRKG
ncbi:hypothetical protein D3C79_442480 [compost metagenome]